jgi:hypothetical protein
MSNSVNEAILERLMDEVSELTTDELLSELGMLKTEPPMKIEILQEMVVLKRFEELPDGPQ